MHPAIVSGIVIGDAPVSYWPIFFPCLKNSPTTLCLKLASPSLFLFLTWRIFFCTLCGRHLLFNLPVFQKVPKYTLSFPCGLLKSKMKRTLLWFSVHLSLPRQKVVSGFKILDIPLRLKKLMWWSTNKRSFVELYEPKNLFRVSPEQKYVLA